MHIVSEITGKINQNLSPMTVIRILPTGTVSGAPKLRAIEKEVISTMPHKRGVL